MRIPIVMVVVILACVTELHSQDYKRLRLSIGSGLASPLGKNGTPGWVASAEPGFRLTNNLLIGLKAESAVLTREISRNIAFEKPTTQFISGSVFAQYYLSPNYVRPFVCGGAGYSIISDETLQVNYMGSSETLWIGKDQIHFMLRAGIEVWHISAHADLMFSPDEKPTDFLEIKNSVLSIRLMFLIGGGLR